MRQPIQPQDRQHYLFKRDPEEWISADHPARFIRDFIDSLDLVELGFHEPSSREGGRYYLPETLLKIWIYGYYEDIRLTRQLERACRSRIELIWLTGDLAPDHNTLWRFLRGHQEAIERVFIRSIQVAADSGMVGLKLHGLDGTKIKASCSNATGLHRTKLEKMLRDLETDARNYIDAVEEGHETDAPSYRLPKHLEDPEKLKEAIKGSLAMLDEVDLNHLHPGEPDARMMKGGGQTDFGYNAQAVVDSEAGIIVAADVTGEEHDYNQLVPMVEQARDNLGESCEETAADGGYASSRQLAKAEEEGLEVLVNLGKRLDADDEHKFDRRNFRYEKESDEVICPLGKRLTFERVKRNRRGKSKVRVYRCRCARDCPERSQCSTDKRGRAVEIGPHFEALQRQREKNRDPSKKKCLERRFEFVERCFAHIKQHRGFRRWTMRDLNGVKTQWRMLCITSNLRKLYKIWCDGVLILDKSPPPNLSCCKVNSLKT